MNSTQNTPTPLVEAQAEAWLVKLDGRPDDQALRQQFEQWCNADPSHIEAYTNAQLLWQLTRQLELPDDVAEPDSPVDMAVQKRPRGWYAMAATVLLAAGIGLQQYDGSAAEFVSGDQRASFALADGSTLLLNHDTRINTDFSTEQRQLQLLTGEAEFDVAHDGRPFKVQAAGLSVQALGTVFVVGNMEGSQWVSVTESKVEACHSEYCVHVSAGEQLVLKDGKFGEIEKAPRNHLSSWQRGLIIAQNRTVDDLLHELNRYYPGKIILLAEGVGQRRLNTVLNIDKPEQALQALAATLKLQLTAVGPLALLR